MSVQCGVKKYCAFKRKQKCTIRRDNAVVLVHYNSSNGTRFSASIHFTVRRRRSRLTRGNEWQ